MITHPILRVTLLEMKRIDQLCRLRTDDGRFEDMQKIDKLHTAQMSALIALHGWPKISMVGQDGASAAWLLVQHADLNPSFQRGCLQLLESAVAEGEASKIDLAYLTDRVLCASVTPQRYGTQGRYCDGVWTLSPCEDEDALDERRRAVGLGPVADYIETFKRKTAA